MARDLQVSRNCKNISRNWGNLIDLLFFRKKSKCLSYFVQNEWLAENWEHGQILLLPPTPSHGIWLAYGDDGKILLPPPPPPTEPRRLLEITEKTQEIQHYKLNLAALMLSATRFAMVDTFVFGLATSTDNACRVALEQWQVLASLYMYKSTKGLLPDSVSSMVIPIHNVHDHNLRNQNAYYIQHVRTNCRKFTIYL